MIGCVYIRFVLVLSLCEWVFRIFGIHLISPFFSLALFVSLSPGPDFNVFSIHCIDSSKMQRFIFRMHQIDGLSPIRFPPPQNSKDWHFCFSCKFIATHSLISLTFSHFVIIRTIWCDDSFSLLNELQWKEVQMLPQTKFATVKYIKQGTRPARMERNTNNRREWVCK